MQVTDINPLALPSLPLNLRQQLPSISAIYFAIDSNNQVLYIGRSTNLAQRWVQHHRYAELKALANVRIAWIEVSDLSLLSVVELALINYFNPSLNKKRVKIRRLVPKEGLGRIKWRLAVLMADREMDYRELAKATGMHPVTVSKHKNMRTMPSRLEDTTLERYCKALNCQPGDLLVYLPDPDEDNAA